MEEPVYEREKEAEMTPISKDSVILARRVSLVTLALIIVFIGIFAFEIVEHFIF